MEDTVATWDPEAQPHEGKGRDSHQRSDSPVPIRAMSGDSDLRGGRVEENVGVCVQRIVGSSLHSEHLA